MWSSRSKLLEEGTFASLNWQLWIRGQYPMVTALAIPVIGPNSEQYTQISAGRIYSDDHTVYCMPSGQLVNTLAMEAHFRSPTSNSVTNPKESSSQIREWTNSECTLCLYHYRTSPILGGNLENIKEAKRCTREYAILSHNILVVSIYLRLPLSMYSGSFKQASGHRVAS